MQPLVSYLRVSTSGQGKSGLGVEAQRAAVVRFAEVEGFEIVAEHVEIETGKGADALERRPKLAAALAEARRRKCAVIVAKLYRSSRDVAFVAGLMSQRVAFIVAELGAETLIRSCCICMRPSRRREDDDLRSHNGRLGSCKATRCCSGTPHLAEVRGKVRRDKQSRRRSIRGERSADDPSDAC